MMRWILIFAFLPMPLFARTGLIQKFDHQFHETKVFSQNKIKCSDCHNLEESRDQKMTPLEALARTTFKKSIKQICHDCHQGEKFPTAPKACYTCHDTQDRMLNIKPLNHQNAVWKSQHATQARADSSQCVNCHSVNQCSKCHSARNPVTNTNHSRNYKYFHSIEARMSPQKCDTCHNKSYCVRCHLGGVK
ncbi:MAG: hypothetical protein KUL82_04730 [Bdellovibrio sp.]|nr:hypothetical protein [Bdellovibrio sp.]